ncbi:MAG: helix-turn-helix domain-containing protein [Acidobacteria bacterium]|jgi:excisionase family DNA binding protein|nr:helix-turn-helix domain-containing protein [Acidobacteriota bacterium]
MNKEAKQPKEVPVNPPKFLTVEEVAEMLRIKVRTVYEMVSQNRIPFRKAGRRTVFLLDEILEWTTPHQ